MEIIWIIGAGKFGKHALQGLSGNSAVKKLVMVDMVEPGSFLHAEGIEKKVEFIRMDGVTFLKEYLKPDGQPPARIDSDDTINGRKVYEDYAPDWIIPALPVHLAARWCQAMIEPNTISSCELPSEVDCMLPNTMRGANGDMYVSHADFYCPSSCNEPDKFCTVTGKPRKQDMHNLIAETKIEGFHNFVIQSRQLGPGIGGFRPKTLFELLKKVQNVKGKLVITTACRCHGVLTGLKK
ncbi:conserved hypothetical protein [Desulfamplus magnetovallimortis]|uniref:Uncharacterized protein n=1 Tax=Desulfamplus magnetovallimortis TaxID=1246637 RepID=A0A1W1H7M0_9BACT|nr:hypothetical protein [Desulfamplus magnetovallimortis]SLM28368.1 conserved hypothetical protein [Desulfamplus magnetovallimortis]